MRSVLFVLLIFCAVPTWSSASEVKIEVGKPAPDFELQDASGKTHRLSDYRGQKNVVLEFFRSGDW